METIIELVITAFVGLVTAMVHAIVLLIELFALAIELLVYLVSRGPNAAKQRAVERRTQMRQKGERRHRNRSVSRDRTNDGPHD